MSGAGLNKILLVEDDLDIQEVAVLALRDFGGFEVETANNGVEALDMIGDVGPDLVLLDVMMPELDGPATLKELQARDDTSSIPVIFMTARTQPHEIKEYLDLGAIEVIKKPFDPIELGDDIRTIWDKFHER